LRFFSPLREVLWKFCRRAGGQKTDVSGGLSRPSHLRAGRIRCFKSAVSSRLEWKVIECFVGVAGVSNRRASRLDFSSPLDGSGGGGCVAWGSKAIVWRRRIVLPSTFVAGRCLGLTGSHLFLIFARACSGLWRASPALRDCALPFRSVSHEY